jgi:hypothetical protein
MYIITFKWMLWQLHFKTNFYKYIIPIILSYGKLINENLFSALPCYFLINLEQVENFMKQISQVHYIFSYNNIIIYT